MWDLETGKETLTLRGHTALVTSLALAADGKRLFSGSADNTIKVWDLDAGKETLTLRGQWASRPRVRMPSKDEWPDVRLSRSSLVSCLALRTRGLIGYTACG